MFHNRITTNKKLNDKIIFMTPYDDYFHPIYNIIISKIEYLDGKRLYNAIVIGIKNLVLHQKTLDEINVFPVPDGDTGTNMYLTLKNLDLDLSSKKDIKSFLLELKQSSLMEARGNSGVILSQFFQGL